MEITRTDNGDQTAVLSVHIAPEDYREQVKSVIKDYAKKANIKGFRQGKVPPSVIRRMYGKGVIYEELNKIISSSLQDYVTSNELATVGEPLPTTTDIDLDPNAEKDYTFDFEIGLAPEVSVDYGLLADTPSYEIEIDDETIDKEVQNLQNTYGPMTNPETSAEGDIVFGKVYEVDGDGNEVEEGFSRMYALNPDRVENEDLLKTMADGKKEGDIFPFDLSTAMRNDNEVRRFLEENVSKEKVREVSDEELEDFKNKSYHFEVRKINRTEPMELGEELYNKAFGEGTVTSEEEMRDRLRSDLEKFFEREGQRYYRSQAIKALIEGTEISLPDEFLKKWLVRTREKITENDIDELYPAFERSLKWKLMVDEFAKKDDSMKIEEEDLKEKARESVRQQFGAMVGDNEEQMDQFVNYYMQDQNMVNKLYEELQEDKIFTHLENENPPVAESITSKDFLEKLKNAN